MVNLFSRLKVQRLEIQLHAGEGETEVFKTFHVRIDYSKTKNPSGSDYDMDTTYINSLSKSRNHQ